MNRRALTSTLIVAAGGIVLAIVVVRYGNAEARKIASHKRFTQLTTPDCRHWDGGAAALPDAPIVRSSSDPCLVLHSLQRELAAMAETLRHDAEERRRVEAAAVRDAE